MKRSLNISNLNTDRQNDVLANMDQTLSGWQQSGDRRRIFLGCYRMMTANMLAAIDEKYFEDQLWVNTLLHHFAEYYFMGLNLDGRRKQIPEVWKQVHDQTRRKQLHPIQYLLMGVNAHINYDLVLTLYDILHPEWTELQEDQKRCRFQDHCRVNDVITATIDKVQDEILLVEDPKMGWLDSGMGRLDEYLISYLISDWREDVWDNAQQMINISNPNELEEFRKNLEEDVLVTGSRISFGS
jgi:hypothetical protein